MLPKTDRVYEDFKKVLNESIEFYKWNASGADFFQTLWEIDNLLFECQFDQCGFLIRVWWWKRGVDDVPIPIRFENVIELLSESWANQILFNLNLFT